MNIETLQAFAPAIVAGSALVFLAAIVISMISTRKSNARITALENIVKVDRVTIQELSIRNIALSDQFKSLEALTLLVAAISQRISDMNRTVVDNQHEIIAMLKDMQVKQPEAKV